MIPQTKPYISVYEPVYIEIDGKQYALKRRNRTVMRQLVQLGAKLETATDEEKADIVFDQLGLLIDAPQEVLDGLDVNEVKAISRWIVDVSTGKVMPGEGEGKNLESPGGETSPA